MINKLWRDKKKISFDSHSTKQALEVLFSRRKVSTSHPCISFINFSVIKEHAQKHLRLFLGNCLHEVHSNESSRRGSYEIPYFLNWSILLKSQTNFENISERMK